MQQNFDLTRELAEQSDKDWKFGAASQPGIVSIPEAERDQWLPQGETQFSTRADFSDCASRSPVNHAEALMSYHYAHLMMVENKKWLEDNGYVENGRVTFSDRYIAVLSGTTRQGNSLKSPLETIRTQGLIPKKLLPKSDDMTWEEYYDATKITQALKDLGQQFRARFPMNYEQVNKVVFTDALKNDMIGVAGYAWAKPIDGVYLPQSPSMGFNHAFLIFRHPSWQIFDNYYDFTVEGQQILGDFTKNLSPDYNFFDYGYRLYISAENLPAYVFRVNLAFGIVDPDVPHLQKSLVTLGYPIPHAVTDFFGPETRTALASFQRDNNIQDDGTHFGPLTRYAMNKARSPSLSFVGSIQLFIQTFLGIW